MACSENPILKNIDTGNIIDVNISPFTIGRSLVCNFVIPSGVVSRKHCILEKNEENGWVLQDTSTNGTYLNGRLIKSTRSPPLKEADIIGLSLEDEQYTFHCSSQDDISDEQLCMIADSVLQEVEVVTEVITDPIENVISVPLTCTKDSNPAQQSSGISSCPGPASGKRTETNSTPNPSCNSGSDIIIIENDNENGRYPNKIIKLDPKSSVMNISIVDLTNQSICSAENHSGTDAAGSSNAGNEIEVKADPPEAIAKPSTMQTVQDNIDEMEDEMQCSICSEMFVKATTLNCSHTFCKLCIETWRKNKSECPICRCKITSLTKTLVLDNIIEKMVENASDELKTQRKTLLEERQKQDCQKPVKSTKKSKPRSRRGRGRTQNQGWAANRYDPTSAYAYNPINNASVIEVESSSSSSSSLTDYEDWREEYDNDEWYDSVPGAHYSGYGHCFSCGSRGHWRNRCPYR